MLLGDHSNKRKRGRPKKVPTESCVTVVVHEQSSLDHTNKIVKRGRGRPKKETNKSISDNVISTQLKTSANSFVKLGRGRPKKGPTCTPKIALCNQSIEIRKRGRPSKTSIGNISIDILKNLSSSIEKRLRRNEGIPVKIWSSSTATIEKDNSFSNNCDQELNSNSEAPPGKHCKTELDETNVDSTAIDHHSQLYKGPLKLTDPPEVVISKYCRLMYKLGWATGTGGGMSVKKKNIIYIAPSGVQKEMIEPNDVFKCDQSGDVISAPNNQLKLSECAPLFMNAYKLRDAGAVIHSHGIFAVLASLLFKDKEFRISHMEMIKGIKRGSTNVNLKYDDTLVVPIVENTLYESSLTKRMQIAMKAYPESNAVLVRRHGVYIWGNSWEKAKSQAECYHYLFEAAVKMKQMGIDPAQDPCDETGITDDDSEGNDHDHEEETKI